MTEPSSKTPAISRVSEQMYALRDPDTQEIRYIGKANEAQARLVRHKLDMRRRNTPVYCWMRKLASEGKSPTIEVIASATDGWQELERALIAQHRADGARLLNLAEGGDQPLQTREQRAAAGKAAAKARQVNFLADPRKRRIWELKKQMPWILRKLESMEATRRSPECARSFAIAP